MALRLYSDGDLESQGVCLGDVDTDELVFYSSQDWPFQPLFLWPRAKDACRLLDIGAQPALAANIGTEAGATISLLPDASGTLDVGGQPAVTISIGTQPTAVLNADACEVY